MIIVLLFINNNINAQSKWQYDADYILIESIEDNNTLIKTKYKIDITKIDSSLFRLSITNSTTNNTIYDLIVTYLEYTYDDIEYDNCHLLNDGEFIIIIRQCVQTDVIMELTMITISDNTNYAFTKIVFGSFKYKL